MDDLDYVRHLDPELVESDPETAHAASNYMRRRFKRYRSHYSQTSSGAELYRNRQGRCEDAPCCGCCNY